MNFATLARNPAGRRRPRLTSFRLGCLTALWLAACGDGGDAPDNVAQAVGPGAPQAAPESPAPAQLGQPPGQIATQVEPPAVPPPVVTPAEEQPTAPPIDPPVDDVAVPPAPAPQTPAPATQGEEPPDAVPPEDPSMAMPPSDEMPPPAEMPPLDEMPPPAEMPPSDEMPPPAELPPSDEMPPPNEVPTPPANGGGIRPAKAEGFGADVTGGEGGMTVTASTGTEIHKAICDRAADDTPLVIMISGNITPGNTTKQSGNCNTKDGVLEIKEVSNLSLIGVGTSGVLDQVGVHLRAASNIIIQNLTIKNVRKSNTSTPSNGGDAIGMESGVSRVWVDHNLIHGSTTEGEEHDGLIDMKAETTDVTISYNHMHTGGRGGLVASNDDGGDGSTRISWHHNWYQNINSRTHLVREAHGHFYNNYYEKIHSTGINCRNGASLLIEGNHFTEARNPLGIFYYLGNQGKWELKDNLFDSSVVWDPSDDELVAGPNPKSTGSVSVPYSYSLDPSAETAAIVMANAGVGKL